MRLMPLFLSLGLCLSVACQQVKPAVEDDPGEQAKAQAAASRYITAFVSGDLDTVLMLSAVPFWGDGDRFDSLDQLSAEVTRQLQDLGREDIRAEVAASHFMTLEQTRVVLPDVYERIQAADLAQPGLYVVALRMRVNQQGEERGVILVRQDHDGLWKVVGIGD